MTVYIGLWIHFLIGRLLYNFARLKKPLRFILNNGGIVIFRFVNRWIIRASIVCNRSGLSILLNQLFNERRPWSERVNWNLLRFFTFKEVIDRILILHILNRNLIYYLTVEIDSWLKRKFFCCIIYRSDSTCTWNFKYWFARFESVEVAC